MSLPEIPVIETPQCFIFQAQFSFPIVLGSPCTNYIKCCQGTKLNVIIWSRNHLDLLEVT